MRYLNKINELFSKESDVTGINNVDSKLAELFDILTDHLKDSPILFKTDFVNDSIIFTNPFNLKLIIDKHEQNGLSFVRATIGKDVIVYETGKTLWDSLKISNSFKLFVKGTNVETFNSIKRKEILKTAKTAKWKDPLIIDYLKYVEPEIVGNYTKMRTDATSNTNIYDVTQLIQGLDPMLSANMKMSKKIQHIFNAANKNNGIWEGVVDEETINAIRQIPVIDVVDNTGDHYKLTMYSPYENWKDIFTRLRPAILGALGYDNIVKYDLYLYDNAYYNLHIGIKTSIN